MQLRVVSRGIRFSWFKLWNRMKETSQAVDFVVQALEPNEGSTSQQGGDSHVASVGRTAASARSASAAKNDFMVHSKRDGGVQLASGRMQDLLLKAPPAISQSSVLHSLQWHGFPTKVHTAAEILEAGAHCSLLTRPRARNHGPARCCERLAPVCVRDCRKNGRPVDTSELGGLFCW